MNDEKGFSLLELIVIIVISAVVAVFVYNFVHFSTINAATEVGMVTNRLNVENAVERITSEYKRLIAVNNTSFSIADLVSYIQNNSAPAEVESLSYVIFDNDTGVGESQPTEAGGGVLKVTLKSGDLKVNAYFAQ